MKLLEQLILSYESSEEMSIDTALKEILENNPEHESLSVEDAIELQRDFIEYVQYANEAARFDERIEKGYLKRADAEPVEGYLNSYLPLENRKTHKRYIESFIDNISVPRSLAELKEFFLNGNDAQMLLRDLDTTDTTCWTSPRWAKHGDIVLFMHAKTARTHLTRIKTEIRETYPEGSGERKKLLAAVDEQIDFHSKFGGKIYVIGRVSGKPFKEDVPAGLHNKSNIFCDIDDLFYLKRPIDLSEFNGFIKLNSMGAITPVFGSEYDRLKKMIIDYNEVPEYFAYSFSTPFPHNTVNSENWIKLGLEYRYSFNLEIQFRSCYVNYLLSELGDRKTIYRECACIKGKNPTSFVDNVIYINDHYLPVEVKLNIKAETNLPGQCEKYSMLDRLILDTKTKREARITKVIKDKVMVIDTFGIYMFDAYTKEIKGIYDLNNLTSKEKVKELKSIVISELNCNNQIIEE